LQYGERIAAAIDARDGRVSIGGWTSDADVSPLELAIRLRNAGIARIVYTDVTRDGTMRGPNIAATCHIAQETGLRVIASGGVSSLDDLRALARVVDAGVEGVVVGRALYEGAFTLREAIAAAEGG
jgi:phosphoribosylformimino-5-aminoimidazole carboxamide ribotide isomerase